MRRFFIFFIFFLHFFSKLFKGYRNKFEGLLKARSGLPCSEGVAGKLAW